MTKIVVSDACSFNTSVLIGFMVQHLGLINQQNPGLLLSINYVWVESWSIILFISLKQEGSLPGYLYSYLILSGISSFFSV